MRHIVCIISHFFGTQIPNTDLSELDMPYQVFSIKIFLVFGSSLTGSFIRILNSFVCFFVLVHESASCHWSRFGSLPRTQGESRHVKVQIRIKVHLRLLLNTY